MNSSMSYLSFLVAFNAWTKKEWSDSPSPGRRKTSRTVTRTSRRTPPFLLQPPTTPPAPRIILSVLSLCLGGSDESFTELFTLQGKNTVKLPISLTTRTLGICQPHLSSAGNGNQSGDPCICHIDHCLCLPSTFFRYSYMQGEYIGFNTGNREKLSNSQAAGRALLGCNLVSPYFRSGVE